MYDKDKIWEAVIAVILAVFGGLARALNLKDSKKLKWSGILSEMFISGFAGIMILMFARGSGLSGDWVGVVCGMAGWIGPKILNIVAKTAVKMIEINTYNRNGADKEDDKDND